MIKMSKKNIFKITDDIFNDAKNLENDEHYNTGLVGEGIIVSAYKKMPLDKLEKMQFILSKIIKRKKEQKYMNIARENIENEKK